MFLVIIKMFANLENDYSFCSDDTSYFKTFNGFVSMNSTERNKVFKGLTQLQSKLDSLGYPHTKYDLVKKVSRATDISDFSETYCSTEINRLQNIEIRLDRIEKQLQTMLQNVENMSNTSILPENSLVLRSTDKLSQQTTKITSKDDNKKVLKY